MVMRWLALSLVLMAAGMGVVLRDLDGIAAEAGSMEMPMSGGGMGGHMMGDRLPPGIEPDALPEPHSEGAALLSRYCTQCHNLPSPGLHSAEEWPPVAGRMFHRMAMASNPRHRGGMMRRRMPRVLAPSSAEQAQIVAYLTQHALRPAPPRTPEAPETPEAALFRQTCSRCHALPDSASHTADEWPLVVERMRKNMAKMGKAGISDQERDAIVRHLQQRAR
jgi:cytochrome c5